MRMLGGWLETIWSRGELGQRGELWSPQHPDGVESVGLPMTSRGAGGGEEGVGGRGEESLQGRLRRSCREEGGKPGEPGVPEVREERDSKGRAWGPAVTTLDSKYRAERG